MSVRQPNVLILFTDQQRYDTIHRAGYPHMITPNLDRLAEQGCLYTRAYTSNPVCMAARHDLLTGLPGRAHGYYGNHKGQSIKNYALPTLPRLFSENGYRTAAVGKMHFQPPRMHHGYDELLLMEEIPRRRQEDQYATFLMEQGLGEIQNVHGVRANLYHTPQTALMDEARHPNRWVADQTIDWLKRNRHHPFLLFASWIHPHPPWALPRESQGLYRDRELPAPLPRARRYPYLEPEHPAYGDRDDPSLVRATQEAYLASVTHVDTHIGRVLDWLEAEGLIDQTIVIFTSDHGEMLYDRGMFMKSSPYESSVRIPFIVRYPDRFAPGTTCDDFVDLLDLMPTCLDVCGLTYPAQADQPLVGHSLTAASEGRDRSRQISCFGLGANRWVMCRDQRYKYIYYYNRGTEEVYDLLQDPGELHNIIGSGREPHEAAALRSAAIEFEQQWGPEGMIVDGTFAVLEGGVKQPPFGAKYGNVQFHRMDERPPRDRGEQFAAECEQAARTVWHPEWTPDEIWHDAEYVRSFQQSWQAFAGDSPAYRRLFRH